jgi:hypothetical protein
MMNHIKFYSLCVLAISLFACNSAKKQAEAIMIEFGKKPTIIYKAKPEYANKVPVTLSADKQQIVAYPAPKDLYTNEVLALPTALEKGYYLDNRGVNNNTAFLNISYEEYAKLEKAPSMEELKSMIIASSSVEECYDCGNITEIEKLNILIKGKALAKCKRMDE